MDSASAPTTEQTTTIMTGLQGLDYLERLPTELVANLLQLAGPQACVRVACSSRRLWQIGVAHPALWRSLYISSFPLDDKEMEWLEWCSSIISLEESKEELQMDRANDEHAVSSTLLQPMNTRCGSISPIDIRGSNPISSPPPVLRGALVRWFRLFGRRVYTDRNWRQMNFQPNTLHFPGTLSKTAWHELHIWKSCLSNTIFFLDAHVRPHRRPTKKCANDELSCENRSNNMGMQSSSDTFENINNEHGEHSFLQNDNNELFDDTYDSCNSSDNENEFLLEDDDPSYSNHIDSTTPIMIDHSTSNCNNNNNHEHDGEHDGSGSSSQLFIFQHQPGAVVRELHLGSAYSRLSLRRAPIARSNSQYVIVDGDAILKTTTNNNCLSVNEPLYYCNENRQLYSDTTSRALNRRSIIQRRIWVWRVDDTEPILTLYNSHPEGRTSIITTVMEGTTPRAMMKHLELTIIDLMGNWLLCRRKQESTNGLVTDYVVYDLSRYPRTSSSTVDEHELPCIGRNAINAHFQRVSDEAAVINKYGQVNRLHTHKGNGGNGISVHVYSHSYIDDDTCTTHGITSVESDETTKNSSKSIAWQVDAICYSNTDKSLRRVASGVCRSVIPHSIVDGGTLVASRIDNDRVLLQVQSFIMDTVWLAVLSIGEHGGILWQQRGSFFRPELYTSHGFIAVNSTIVDDDNDNDNDESSESLGASVSSTLLTSYGKSTLSRESSDPYDSCVYYCDSTACRRSISSDGRAHFEQPSNDDKQQKTSSSSSPSSPSSSSTNTSTNCATAVSKTIVLSTNNSNSIADGKKHSADYSELSDISQEQRKSFVRLLCLAHGQPIRPPMQFTGLCRTIRIIGSIGLTTPASSAEWYFCVTDIAEGRPLSRLDFIQRGNNLKGQICSTYSVMVDEDRPGYYWVFNFSEPNIGTATNTICN